MRAELKEEIVGEYTLYSVVLYADDGTSTEIKTLNKSDAERVIQQVNHPEPVFIAYDDPYHAERIIPHIRLW